MVVTVSLARSELMRRSQFFGGPTQAFHPCHHYFSIHRIFVLADTIRQITGLTWCLRTPSVVDALCWELMWHTKIYVLYSHSHRYTHILFFRPNCPQYSNLFFPRSWPTCRAIHLCPEVHVYSYLRLLFSLKK